MTSRDHDAPELEALRSAFAALPVPDATPTLDRSDRETRAAVNWMAEAFAALPVPEVVVPESSRSGRRPQVSSDTQTGPRHAAPLPSLRPSRQTWLRHAAAAAVFAALGLALWWARGAEQAVRAPTDDHAPLVASTDTDIATHATRPAPIPGFREAAPGSSGLVAVTTDHLEVSSGPVRLVLMTTGPLARGPSHNLP